MNKIKKITALFLSAILLFSLALPTLAATNNEPFPDSEYFTVGDYTIHYRVFEAEEAKGQIFMIHGFALSSYCFENLARCLQTAGYTAVIADLPDFGYSTRENENTNILPRENIMHALMTDLSSDPWYLAGHSMGGFVAIAIAEKYPESVKNLILYGTSGNEGVSDARSKLFTNKTFIRFMGKVLEFASRLKSLVRLLLFTASADLEFTKDYDVSYIMDPYLIEGTGEGVLYNFSALPATDFDAFRNLSPVLYLNASNDNIIEKSAIRKLRTYLPEGSTDVTLPDGGHLFIESRAEKTAEITLEFLNNH